MSENPSEKVQFSDILSPTPILLTEIPIVELDIQQAGLVDPLIKSIQKIPTFFIWSIFNLLFIPFGLMCCYFSYKVNQFKTLNNYETATMWSTRTFIANIITTLLMFGIIIAVTMLHYDYEKRYSGSVFVANQTTTTEVYIPWQPGR